MSRVTVVWGTRPEAIKLGPVVAALRAAGVPVRCIATGQHTTLLQGSPAASDLAGSESLELPSDGNVPKWSTLAMRRLEKALLAEPTELVVVQGDTMSASVGANTASSLGIEVAHVEAGVRSHDASEPWPEEQTRIAIAKLASWHYAPTSTAFSNLVSEGVPLRGIRVTGNTGVSALARYGGADTREVLHSGVAATPSDTVFVTLHRRELQTPLRATEASQAVGVLAAAHPELSFLWPVHPALQRFLPAAGLVVPGNLTMCQPLPYSEVASRLPAALAVVTDSGGLVEEATALGVPSVIVRHRNDRPEAVAAGLAVQCEPTAPAVLCGFSMARELQRRPNAAFGSVDAAQLVADHIASLQAR